MKKLSALFICTIFLLIPLSEIFAQSGREIDTYKLIQDLSPGYMDRFENEIDAEGSPYLFNEFLTGSLTFMNGRTVENVSLRFNIHEENIQFRNDGAVFVVGKEIISKIEMEGQNEVITLVKGFESRQLDKDNFVEIAVDGNAKLLVKYDTILRQDNAAYGASANTSEFTTSETYYVKFGDADTERLRRLNNRRVMRVFPDHEDELEQFVDSRNLQLDDFDNVVALFKYYNTL